MSSTIRRRAPAKVNMGLHVLRRRPDDFHEIDTVLVPINWADDLVAAPNGSLELRCDDPALPLDERNLVIRAARALATHAGVRPAAALALTKRIPYGAGLGGGSSDAAAALLALNELWSAGASADELRGIAAGLGSDVPFFLQHNAARATGRGETLQPLRRGDGTPWRMPFPLVVAVPPTRVSTAAAYALVTPNATDRSDLGAAILSDDPDRWRRDVHNDFQHPVAARHREVADALGLLDHFGALYSSLSGSGSGVFGVFERDAQAGAAASALEASGCVTHVQQGTRETTR